MKIFNLAEELEKERKKNEELKKEKKKLNYLISGLSRENKEKQDIIIDLVKRISKAIEYIENDLQSFLYSAEYNTLLDILKGENKNE